MTYQSLLSAHSALQSIDTESMDVQAKVTLYRQLQYAEDELTTYRQSLQDIAGGSVSSLEDLSDEKRGDLQELLQTRVDTDPPKPLEQEQLPNSITVEQIAALDRAGLVSLE